MLMNEVDKPIISLHDLRLKIHYSELIISIPTAHVLY